MIGRQGRHPAPIVDAGGDDVGALGGVDQIGRRLHPHRRSEQQSRDGDRGPVLGEIGVGHLLTLLQFGTLPAELTRKNMELYATSVMPWLRERQSAGKTQVAAE